MSLFSPHVLKIGVEFDRDLEIDEGYHDILLLDFQEKTKQWGRSGI